MSLSTKLADNFDAATRNGGSNYFFQGRVYMRGGSGRHAEARVRGHQSYEVTLEWQNGVLFAACDCLYYDSVGPCKHLWATILAADRHGYLSAAASAPRITLDWESDDAGGESGGLRHGGTPSSPMWPEQRPVPWRRHLASITERQSQRARFEKIVPRHREVLYMVEAGDARISSCLILSLASRDRKSNGDWTRPKPLSLKFLEIAQLPLAEDRELVSALGGGAQYYGYSENPYLAIPTCYQVAPPLATSVIPRAARAGRCYLRDAESREDPLLLSWDEGAPWQFKIEMRPGKRTGWEVTGILHRGEERMEVTAPALLTPGFVFNDGRVAPIAEDIRFEWITELCQTGAIRCSQKDKDELLAALLSAPGAPPLDVPEELRYEEITLQPRPCLRIRAPDQRSGGSAKLRADLAFDYEGQVIPATQQGGGIYDAAQRRFLRRDSQAEAAAATLLKEFGARFQYGNRWDRQPAWDMAPGKLPRIARALLEAGWHVEAEGKVFRRPGSFHIEVSSGVDWFELHGKVEYSGSTAQLPQLLEALRRGEAIVRLDDGTFGMLPEEWLRRIGMLAGMGAAEDGHLRFRRSQAGLLDALLATQPEACCDGTFARVRDELRQFERIEAALQPEGFVGHLRDYQRQGLGWMEFLRRFSFGGCLADDMGVGKTAQVLALLETRRELRGAEPVRPSLVVVPRSLIFNWKQEAARFTPRLRVLDYTGAGRSNADFSAFDVVLTTYGTLRRDAIGLKDAEFDYVVLDEAQAIKNAGTDAAKAARLLRGTHRLALSGTPVENHLGELWSLFEFLNPGMLGAASVFKLAGGAARNPSEETRRLLAQALRPFILRRTKEQVAPELPAKTEQTVYCELKPVQRQLYDELRQYYRDTLLKRVETEGLEKSKIQVLEALLRLRQAACHPGLIDRKRSNENSAKLDALLAHLYQVLDEGHKALVFSQFTTLLRIVRDRLEGDGITYEYLDGATRDRQAPVERFQNEPNCRLFLISLKAGGLGLNLTAAEYVFLLDPWWNPAVETQAIDRAHRIGQTRQIFAYRLIARHTVEGKILDLQNSKRELASDIISTDNSLIRDLRREDLELLLS